VRRASKSQKQSGKSHPGKPSRASNIETESTKQASPQGKGITPTKHKILNHQGSIRKEHVGAEAYQSPEGTIKKDGWLRTNENANQKQGNQKYKRNKDNVRSEAIEQLEATKSACGGGMGFSHRTTGALTPWKTSGESAELTAKAVGLKRG